MKNIKYLKHTINYYYKNIHIFAADFRVFTLLTN